MAEPLCAHCHPCRPEDIDPLTTIYLCPPHLAAHDELLASIAPVDLVPLPRDRPPLRFPTGT